MKNKIKITTIFLIIIILLTNVILATPEHNHTVPAAMKKT